MEQKQKIVIITSSIAVLALVGINLFLFAYSNNSTDTRTSVKETNATQVISSPTVIVDEQNLEASIPTFKSTGLPIDLETDQAINDLDSALKDLDTNTDIPAINPADFR